MFGGWDPEIVNLVPGDIEIRGNDFYKPLSWNKYENGGSDPWVTKNLFELKNAERVLVEKNVFENNWVDDQNGFAILFTPRSQNGTAPWSVVRDVRFERNWVRNVSAGVNMLGEDDAPGRSSEYTTNILITYNLFEIVHHTKWGGTSKSNPGRFMQVLKGVRKLTVDHNTSFQSRGIGFSMGQPNPDLVFTYKVMRHNDPDTLGNNTGIFGDRTNPGIPTLDKYFFSAAPDWNVLWAGGANIGKYPYYGINDFPQDAAFDSNYVLNSPAPSWGPAFGSATWPGIDAAVASDLTGVVRDRSK